MRVVVPTLTFTIARQRSIIWQIARLCAGGLLHEVGCRLHHGDEIGIYLITVNTAGTILVKAVCRIDDQLT